MQPYVENRGRMTANLRASVLARLLNLANSRMKVFFDIATIARRTDLDGAMLARAIGATFARRDTPLPLHPSMALTGAFGENVAKQRQWQALQHKGRIDASTLAETVDLLHTLLWPASQVAASTSDAHATWQARQL